MSAQCDGGRPACSRCIKKNKRCEYDAEPDEHRSATLKRKCKVFEQRALAGERLLVAMRDLPESEAVGILRRLRAQEGIETVAASLAEPSSRDAQEREISPTLSATGSYSSAGSTAPLPTTFENQSRLHEPDEQQRQSERRSEDAEMSGHSTTDQRLAISFLVDTVANSRTSPQQRPPHANNQATPLNPLAVQRMASYPPLSIAAVETNRRASAPSPYIVAGPQANQPTRENERPQQQIIPSAYDETMQNIGKAPDPGNDWDQYFMSVSSLLKKIGEGPRGGRQ